MDHHYPSISFKLLKILGVHWQINTRSKLHATFGDHHVGHLEHMAQFRPVNTSGEGGCSISSPAPPDHGKCPCGHRLSLKDGPQTGTVPM